MRGLLSLLMIYFVKQQTAKFTLKSMELFGGTIGPVNSELDYMTCGYTFRFFPICFISRFGRIYANMMGHFTVGYLSLTVL